jgi:hypothetical protein
MLFNELIEVFDLKVEVLESNCSLYFLQSFILLKFNQLIINVLCKHVYICQIMQYQQLIIF